MLKYFGVGLSVAACLAFAGCSKVVDAKIERDVSYVVQFSGSDFNVGEVVTSEMPYDPKVNTKGLLLNKALKEHNCDAILLPRYELISKKFGKDVLRITGRKATFKTGRY